MTQINSFIAAELQKLLRIEEQKILDSFPQTERRVAVLELVRAVDLFFLWQDSRPQQAREFGEDTEDFYVYGCNKALQLFIDDTCMRERVPLFRSSCETQDWAASVLYHCGRIAVSEMLLECERAGLGTFAHRDGEIHFDYTQRAIGLEYREKEEFDWLRTFIAREEGSTMQSLVEVGSQIEELMSPLVQPWRNHYIQYTTTLEIDSYYEQRGILVCHQMFGHDSFPGEARFGGLEFDHYRASVAIVVGWILKHLGFAHILARKCTDLDLRNILTVHQEKKVLARYLACAMEIDIEAAEQCLEILTLTNQHKEYLCAPKGAPPPLVEIGKAHLVKSVAGCLNGPFQFMASSLRRRFPRDWDKAVNLREQAFREELYSLFPQERIIRTSHPVTLRQGNKDITDIDAALFDPRNGIAGLFQLKWQEPFGPSIRERESRRRNLLPAATTWIEQTADFLRSATPRSLADSFGIKLADAQRIRDFRLFIVGRNFSHFSGEDAPDQRAAWGLWPQVLRLCAEEYNHKNPIAGLHEQVKRDSPYLKERPNLQPVQFDLGGNRIVVSSTV